MAWSWVRYNEIFLNTNSIFLLADKNALAQLENNLQKAMQTMEGT
jgi:hypothetical protein